ncbi:hypothetical protein QQ054_20715 [Oscillatoria amoena NRMC-F 0135]|nr:hypothetical protein [Oscillatoria amoena NRMC-F 0135]
MPPAVSAASSATRKSEVPAQSTAINPLRGGGKPAHHDQPGLLMINRLGHGFLKSGKSIRCRACHQCAPGHFDDFMRDPRNLRGGFPLTENHLGEPLPPLTVGVDFGEPQIDVAF